MKLMGVGSVLYDFYRLSPVKLGYVDKGTISPRCLNIVRLAGIVVISMPFVFNIISLSIGKPVSMVDMTPGW